MAGVIVVVFSPLGSTARARKDRPVTGVFSPWAAAGEERKEGWNQGRAGIEASWAEGDRSRIVVVGKIAQWAGHWIDRGRTIDMEWWDMVNGAGLRCRTINKGPKWRDRLTRGSGRLTRSSGKDGGQEEKKCDRTLSKEAL